MIRTTLAVLAVPSLALAQSQVPFGGFNIDSGEQVEIAADSLTVDQDAGSIVFEGTVEVGQGELRMAADRITVFYSGGAGTGDIDRLEADGNVTLTNGTEAAEARQGAYNIATGIVTMSGEVLLTQGPNALSGEALQIDLNTGTAQIEGGTGGRVRTILQPNQASQ